MNPHKILIFIPCFNDFEIIEFLASEILNLDNSYSLLVVDDGSFPKISFQNKSDRVYFYRLPYNAGIGCVTNIAFNFSIKNNYDILVRIDADGQHKVADIPVLVNALIKNNLDLVIGARTNNLKFNSINDLFSSTFKYFINKIANYITGFKICDWHSGFMVFSKRSIYTLSSYLFEKYPEVNIILLSSFHNLKVFAYPVTQNYRSFGKSSLNFFASLRHSVVLCILLISFYFQQIK